MTPSSKRKSRRLVVEEKLRNTRSRTRKTTTPKEKSELLETPSKRNLRKQLDSLSIDDSVPENSEKRFTRSAARKSFRAHDIANIPGNECNPLTPIVISRSGGTVRKKSKPRGRPPSRKENHSEDDSFEVSCDDENLENSASGSTRGKCVTPVIVSKRTGTVRKKSKPRNKSKSRKENLFANSSFESSGGRRNLKSPGKKSKNTSNECPTPVKKSRKSQKGVKEKETGFKGLLRCLHTSEVPNELTCREEETKKIKSFVKSAISPSGTSSAMYISGVPGTGKTASTLKVLNELHESKRSKFDYCYVNGMELPQPNRVFVEIYKTIFGGKKISPLNARRILNEKFQISEKRKPLIILIDELDLLCTKKLDIIYDIFNWTTTPSAKVSVIAIANTLDLPERLLNQRITSRLGANRICFQPYEHEQIAKIIKKRTEGFAGLSEDAINLASRKVAALNGDLRKALDILTRATEMAMEKNLDTVTIHCVTAAIQESSSGIDVEYVRGLSLHEKYIIEACISQQLSSGLEEMTVYDSYQQYKRVCLERDVNPTPLENFGRLINRMGECNLLSLNKFNGSMLFRVFKLGMTLSETKFCLENAEKRS
uniref:Origin recognition complex subunit 1 n=1 Tax=Strongyloides papillosus TaxID=174720 RepID=A0A0N5BPH6_STREA